MDKWNFIKTVQAADLRDRAIGRRVLQQPDLLYATRDRPDQQRLLVGDGSGGSSQSKWGFRDHKGLDLQLRAPCLEYAADLSDWSSLLPE